MVQLVSMYVAGGLTLLLAAFHSRFYSFFGWRADFEKVGGLSARIFYTIHLALLLLLLLLGLLTVGYARQLGEATGLALGIDVLLCAFWGWRLVWQLLYFPRQPGRPIPPISIVLNAVFLLLVVAYAAPVARRLW